MFYVRKVKIYFVLEFMINGLLFVFWVNLLGVTIEVSKGLFFLL